MKWSVFDGLQCFTMNYNEKNWFKKITKKNSGAYNLKTYVNTLPEVIRIGIK